MIIHYNNFDDHQLTVAVEVMDNNWDTVMRGKPSTSPCETCGHVDRGKHTDFTSEYVFERSRAREEQQVRLEVENSFERARDAWALAEAARQERYTAARKAKADADRRPDA